MDKPESIRFNPGEFAKKAIDLYENKSQRMSPDAARLSAVTTAALAEARANPLVALDKVVVAASVSVKTYAGMRERCVSHDAARSATAEEMEQRFDGRGNDTHAVRLSRARVLGRGM